MLLATPGEWGWLVLDSTLGLLAGSPKETTICGASLDSWLVFINQFEANRVVIWSPEHLAMGHNPCLHFFGRMNIHVPPLMFTRGLGFDHSHARHRRQHPRGLLHAPVHRRADPARGDRGFAAGPGGQALVQELAHSHLVKGQLQSPSAFRVVFLKLFSGDLPTEECQLLRG